MVNRGRSQGCVTCKQRRVKCDERMPECGHCRRLGLRCGGYDAQCSNARRLRFKDENHKFASKTHKRHAAPQNALVRVPGPRRLAEPDSAVPFFLLQYAAKGRETASARGFYETLIPAYNASSTDSALSLAVSATAEMVLALWQQGSRGLARLPQTAYTMAVGRVLRALQSDEERREPATLMAVVALQLYENITAVYSRRPATGVHQSGAVSLLPYLATDRHSDAGKGIRRFVFHTEIAAAIREKRPLNGMLTAAAGTHGSNPSSVLDAIGAEVALLQASHAGLKGRDGEVADWESVIRSQIQEARRLEGHLLAWEETVPGHWKPLRVTRQQMDPSIPTYRDVCEIYTTCQVASIWNLWRVQRLILAAIIADSQAWLHNHDVQVDTGRLAVQELVDGICCSVPFYLGNLSRPISILDFTDSSIMYPSDNIPSPRPGDASTTATNSNTSHIMAQGPFQMLSPLSRLLSLFSDKPGRALLRFVRAGQVEWIGEQFLRVTKLLHISSVYCEDGAAGCGAQDAKLEAERLAKLVRSGLRFMSGT